MFWAAANAEAQAVILDLMARLSSSAARDFLSTLDRGQGRRIEALIRQLHNALIRENSEALAVVVSRGVGITLGEVQRADPGGFKRKMKEWGEKWRGMTPRNLGLVTPETQRRFGSRSGLAPGSFCYQINSALTRSNVTILDPEGKIFLVRLRLQGGEWKVDQSTF